MAAPLGNKNATKNRPWSDAIRRIVVQNNGKRLRATAERLVEAAETGDVSALKELGDRLDGKPLQAIAAEVDANLTVKIVRFGNNAPE